MQFEKNPFYDTVLNSIDSLICSNYRNSENEIPNNIEKQYNKTNDYRLATFKILDKIKTINLEIDLILEHIKLSQDFALQNERFDTEFILDFSYKNWIIRVNIIGELIIELINIIFKLKFTTQNFYSTFHEDKIVKKHKELYFSLLNFVDFLQENLLTNTENKTIKKERNKIIHSAEFKHKQINLLTLLKLETKFGISEPLESEDQYLQEGLTAEKIKKELNFFTNLLRKYLNSIYMPCLIEFNLTIDQHNKLIESKLKV